MEGITCAAQLRCRLQEAVAVRSEIGSIQRSEIDLPRNRGANRQHQKEFLVENVALQWVRYFIRFHFFGRIWLAGRLGWIFLLKIIFQLPQFFSVDIGGNLFFNLIFPVLVLIILPFFELLGIRISIVISLAVSLTLISSHWCVYNHF